VSFKFISILQIVTAFRKWLQAAPESILRHAGVSRPNHANPLENMGGGQSRQVIAPANR
jgi:hypothetical protein